ncbi:MAG: long-chain fatty acid--CoA ligase [Gemmatimonadetes bacterium]|nr:long-chain fatty acid--CoA ligase [Gemmatimonadota bacterium]
MNLTDRLKSLFADPDGGRDDERFNALALEAFAWQYARNGAYRAYCDRRGRSPATVTHWTGIPAVPTAAFKTVDLVTGDPARAEAVFRTSGTTRGRDARGTHYVPDLSLYHASLLPNFRAMVLPDGARLRMLSLVPGPDEMPDSSLAHMIDIILRTLGVEGSGCFASVERGLDSRALRSALQRTADSGRPVCLLGTSLSFVHLLDDLQAQRVSIALPAGSRLMDTGGFKGSGRVYDERELRDRYAAQLGIAPTHCVNEYGMTELCTQFYDSALRDVVLHGEAGPARKRVPAGARTRIVNPETLEPVRPGENGLLQHFDLANLGSVLAIQTEDMGVQVGDGFRLLGRAPGATPRGCSIAMDELLQSVGRRA